MHIRVSTMDEARALAMQRALAGVPSRGIPWTAADALAELVRPAAGYGPRKTADCPRSLRGVSPSSKRGEGLRGARLASLGTAVPRIPSQPSARLRGQLRGVGFSRRHVVRIQRGLWSAHDRRRFWRMHCEPGCSRTRGDVREPCDGSVPPALRYRAANLPLCSRGGCGRNFLVKLVLTFGIRVTYARPLAGARGSFLSRDRKRAVLFQCVTELLKRCT